MIVETQEPSAGFHILKAASEPPEATKGALSHTSDSRHVTSPSCLLADENLDIFDPSIKFQQQIVLSADPDHMVSPAGR